MVSRSDATLNLASLIKQGPGSPDSVQGEGLLEPESDVLDAVGVVLNEPLRWRVEVSNTGGEDDFIIEGEVSGSAIMECRRCLSEAHVDADARFLMTMAYDPKESDLRLDEASEDDEERLVFGSPDVDFAALLAQLFAIELPLTALCRDDCKGLSLDGINLNEHPELADRATQAANANRYGPSPFAALKDVDLTK